MFRFWAKKREENPPLEGTPSTPRWKNRQTEAGFVVQYLYRGFTRQKEHLHQFQFSADRKNYRALQVVLTEEVRTEVERRMARSLRDNEWYGLVKMEFFRLLDAAENPMELPEQCVAGSEALLQAAEFLQLLPPEE